MRVKKPNIMKNYALTALLTFSLFANAQQYVDLAKAFYANTPINQYDSATNGTRIQEYGLDLTVPIQLKNGNAILTGLYAESISTKVSPDPVSNLTAVYTLNIKLGMLINHTEKLSATYLLLPKLASDFKQIGADDFQMGGVVLFKYKKNPNFNYKFGLYYNHELFGPFFVPLLGIYYLSPNKKFEANLTLPVAADANYKLNNWLKVGVNYFAFTRSYYLNEPFQGNPDNYLVKKTLEAYAYLQFEFAESIVLQTKAGYSFGRNYQIYDEKDKVTWGLAGVFFGDDREPLNKTNFSDGLVFRVRMLYRFHLDEE